MSLTTNIQLEKIARKRLILLNGIFFKDELTISPRRGSYIINMDDSKNQGTHWVGLYIEDIPCYFDSFGIDPPTLIENFMARFSHKGLRNNKQVQNINSGYCGEYVIEFLSFMQNHRNIPIEKRFKMFIDQFQKDVNKNLKILKALNIHCKNACNLSCRC